ncbi:MAG: hypothetical protein KF688_00180 [Pirellulales bacterium]|nr:hypothetical protein [Pirellulales bacterium]
MAGPAQVRSIEAVARFRAALARFIERMQGAVEGLDGQLRRAVDWIEHDQPAYWKLKSREAEDAVHNAKLDLERCLAFPLVSGERPSCRAEKALLNRCKARREFCRGQVDKVKNWKRTLNHEVFEYEGRLGALRTLLESDLALAEAALVNILRRLEDYQIEQAPVTEDLPPVLGDAPPTTPE